MSNQQPNPVHQAALLANIEARTAEGSVVMLFPPSWTRMIPRHREGLAENVLVKQSHRPEQLQGLLIGTLIVVGPDHESEGLALALERQSLAKNPRLILLNNVLTVLEGDELVEYRKNLFELQRKLDNGTEEVSTEDHDSQVQS